MGGPGLNGSSELEALLDELSEKKAKELTPVFVVVSVLLVSGLIGNGSVLLFFWRKANENLATFFIVVLAIVDTLVCLTISLIIMDLSLPYKYPSDVGCRIHTFCKFFTALFSVLLLMTIAINRYRKLCCPFKWQLTLFWARVVVGFDMLIAVALSVPMSLLYKATEIEIPNENNFVVIGSGCISTRDKELRKYLTGINYTLFGSFVVFSVVFVVLYSLQGRVIHKYNKNHARLQCRYEVNKSSLSYLPTEQTNDKPMITTPKLPVPMSVVTKPADQTSTKATEKDQQSSNERKEIVGEVKDKTINKATCSNINKKSREQVLSIKITLMFFIITVGFILSFLPYLIYVVRKSFTRKTTKFASASVKNQLLTNSYLINSVINPIIYGFVHTEFRLFLRRLFCRWRNN